MITAVALFIGSLVLLVYSSDKFIGSSEKIGLNLGISPFIIGVTVVAFGTSLPELATSIVSVYEGSSEIVVGNVIGSNITNVLLVVGLSVVFAGTLHIKRNLMEVDMSLLLGSAFLLWFALKDLNFSFIESLIFSGGLVVFLVSSIKSGQKEEVTVLQRNTLSTYLFLIFGAIGIYFGARYTVVAITDISEFLNINPAVVSLSALALGTSLPEIVVSIAACKKGMPGMAIGNVIGSNIFNTYAVMAIPSFFGEIIIPSSVLSFSLPFMIVISALFGLICYSQKISIWEGLMLLGFYIFFLAELFRMGFV